MTEAIFRGQYQDVPSEDPRVKLRYRVQIRLESFSRDNRQQQHGTVLDELS